MQVSGGNRQAPARIQRTVRHYGNQRISCRAAIGRPSSQELQGAMQGNFCFLATPWHPFRFGPQSGLPHQLDEFTRFVSRKAAQPATLSLRNQAIRPDPCHPESLPKTGNLGKLAKIIGMRGKGDQGRYSGSDQPFDPGHHRRVITCAAQSIVCGRRPVNTDLNETWRPNRQSPRHSRIDQGAIT